MGGRLTPRIVRCAGVAVILLALVVPGLASCGRPAGLATLKSGECKSGDPLAGVYLPSRLKVKNNCLTVSGIVDCVKHEDDGDIHIRLRVDPSFVRLLTPANAFQQCPNQTGPHLVVEIIPQSGHLPFPDNSATDGGFTTPVEPPAGAHITVTGPYVLDTNLLHDLIYPGKNVQNWAEIHPAWNIVVAHSAKAA
jgi:hypothetical protein